ncbi:MAG: tol-pal system protein YbgF [Myxococcota bacterium]
MDYKKIIALMAIYPLAGCYSGLNREQASQFEKIKKEQISLKKRVRDLKNRIVILERNERGELSSAKDFSETEGNPDHIPVLKLTPAEQSRWLKSNENKKSANREEENDDSEEENDSVDNRKSVKLKLYGSKSSPESNNKPLALGTYHELQEPKPKQLEKSKEKNPDKNGESPSKIYELAILKFKSGRYPMALILFSKLVKRFPESRFADNAIFWMGECHYRQSRFKIALKYYEKVIKKYKTGNKVPDSIYKMGLSYWKLKNIKQSKKLLNQVMELYPGTATAKKAAKFLVKLR